MFQCICGSQEFYALGAEQFVFYYDGDGGEIGIDYDIGDSEKPLHGEPFRCANCDKEYSTLPPQNYEEEFLAKRGRQYMQENGLHCPLCGSSDITTSPLTIDSKGAYQECGCLACESGWTDVYKMVDVRIDTYPEDLIPPKKKDPNELYKEKTQ